MSLLFNDNARDVNARRDDDNDIPFDEASGLSEVDPDAAPESNDEPLAQLTRERDNAVAVIEDLTAERERLIGQLASLTTRVETADEAAGYALDRANEAEQRLSELSQMTIWEVSWDGGKAWVLARSIDEATRKTMVQNPTKTIISAKSTGIRLLI